MKIELTASFAFLDFLEGRRDGPAEAPDPRGRPRLLTTWTFAFWPDVFFFLTDFGKVPLIPRNSTLPTLSIASVVSDLLSLTSLKLWSSWDSLLSQWGDGLSEATRRLGDGETNPGLGCVGVLGRRVGPELGWGTAEEGASEELGGNMMICDWRVEQKTGSN